MQINKQTINGNKLKASGKSTGVVSWFMLGLITLMMLGSNFAPIFGIPWWVFMIVIFGLGTALAMQSSLQKQQCDLVGSRPSNRFRIIVFAVVVLAVIAEAIWIGFFMRNWPLFAVWLPATLLASAVLYLFITMVFEKTTISSFLLVPLAAFITGGLLWFIWPGYGYLNLFLFCFTVLSFGTGLWHFRSRSD